MIDLHAHVLPGLDDGPRSADDALAMARVAVGGGIETIAATPHIDHRMGVEPHTVAGHVEAMNDLLALHAIDLRVVPGGEVAATRAPDLSDEALAAVALGGSWVLLECPLAPGTGSTLRRVAEHVRRRGFRVLLAHPERSPDLVRDPSTLRALVAAGAACQVTASAFSGQYGRWPREAALRLMEAELVHVVASDGHDAWRRPPVIEPGLAAAQRELPAVQRLLSWLTREAPAAILAGRDLPPRPPVRLRRAGLVSRLLRAAG